MNHSAAFRAHLLRHHLDPDAFAELPDGTQTEILQTLGDMEAPSEVLAGAHGAASLDEGSLVQQGDGLRAQCDRDRAHSSQGSWNDADDENDGGAELESGLEQWMRAQHAAPVHPRDHQAPANPSALPPDLLQLLQRHGIAVDAFADMPQDIQSEILQSLSEFDDSASQMSADSEDSLSAEYRRYELEGLGMATPAAAPGPVHPERATLPHRPSPVVPTPPPDSRVIFSMGFELALVRRALRYPPLPLSPESHPEPFPNSRPFYPFTTQCRYLCNLYFPSCSACRDDEARAVEMLLSGSVPPEGAVSVSRPSPGHVSQPSPSQRSQQMSPRTPRGMPSTASPGVRPSPQSQQDAALEALQSRVLHRMFCWSSCFE